MKQTAVLVPTSLEWLKFAVVALDSFVLAAQNIDGTDLSLLVPDLVLGEARKIVEDANIDFDVQIHGFDSSRLAGYPITSRWGEVSWYRTVLPSLPEYRDYQRILLIGVDVFCTKIERDIFTYPLTSSIGAIREPRNSPTYQYPPFNDLTSRYFNADVLLYNCEKWLLDNDSAKIREMAISSTNPYPFADQDVLNHYFEEKWDELPATLNWIPAFNNSQTFRRFGDPSIIQWAGKWKPWDSALVPPFKMTRQWRNRYRQIWNSETDEVAESSVQGLTRKKPLKAVLSFYAPVFLPVVNLPPRVRDKFRLIRKNS